MPTVGHIGGLNINRPSVPGLVIGPQAPITLPPLPSQPPQQTPVALQQPQQPPAPQQHISPSWGPSPQKQDVSVTGTVSGEAKVDADVKVKIDASPDFVARVASQVSAKLMPLSGNVGPSLGGSQGTKSPTPSTGAAR